MKYEVIVMHEDDTNERVRFDTLPDAVRYMEKEANAPCLCVPIEQETDD